MKIPNRYGIINGDCRDLFSRIETESVDLVVTDPPYRVISGGRSPDNPLSVRHHGSILEKNDGKIFEYNDISFSEWVPQVYRILKMNTQCYIMTNLLNLFDLRDMAISVGFKLHNLLLWEKNTCTPNRWYMKNGEYTLFLYKGKAKSINDMGSKMIHLFNNPTGNKVHPTEKPVELMRLYVENSSLVGDLVVDPFMGSGSVGEACIKTNRKFIGFEKDREYYQIARNRLATTCTVLG